MDKEMSRMCFFIVCLFCLFVVVFVVLVAVFFSILLTQRPGLRRPDNVAFIAINKQIRVYWMKNGTSITS